MNSIFDKRIHDPQHLLASLAGAIFGLGIFLTYYFFSRIESQSRRTKFSSAAAGDKVRCLQYESPECLCEYPWKMDWYYFVVGIFLCMSTGSALGCMLSVGIRPRLK